MSETYVYDKAKYHFESVEQAGLPPHQAFVHTGLYFGWLLDRDLVVAEVAAAAEKFKLRQITGPTAYQNEDGTLISDMLTDQGNAFSRKYFDFEKGEYLGDLVELTCGGDDSKLFQVEDSWDNYQKIRDRIDQRFTQWKTSRK